MKTLLKIFGLLVGLGCHGQTQTNMTAAQMLALLEQPVAEGGYGISDIRQILVAPSFRAYVDSDPWASNVIHMVQLPFVAGVVAEYKKRYSIEPRTPSAASRSVAGEATRLILSPKFAPDAQQKAAAEVLREQQQGAAIRLGRETQALSPKFAPDAQQNAAAGVLREQKRESAIRFGHETQATSTTPPPAPSRQRYRVSGTLILTILSMGLVLLTAVISRVAYKLHTSRTRAATPPHIGSNTVPAHNVAAKGPAQMHSRISLVAAFAAYWIAYLLLKDDYDTDALFYAALWGALPVFIIVHGIAWALRSSETAASQKRSPSLTGSFRELDPHGDSATESKSAQLAPTGSQASNFIILRSIRCVFGIAFATDICQLALFLMELPQMNNLDSGKVLVLLLFKVPFLLLVGWLFFYLRRLINQMHTKKHGLPHPVLARSKWTI